MFTDMHDLYHNFDFLETGRYIKLSLAHLQIYSLRTFRWFPSSFLNLCFSILTRLRHPNILLHSTRLLADCLKNLKWNRHGIVTIT